MKKVLSFLIKIGVLALAFIFIFYPEWLGLGGLFGGIKPTDIWNQLKEAGQYSMGWLVFWLALASAVKMLGIFAGITKWSLLLRGQDLRLPFGYLTHVWFMGRLVGWMVPGGFGLDAWRLVETSRYTGDWVKCTTVVAIDKLIGFISLTFLVLVTFPFGFAILDINPVVFAAILVFLGGFTLFCFTLLFNPRIIQIAVTVLPLPGKIRGAFLRFGAAATAYSGHRKMLLLAVLFGVFNHFATSIMFFFTMLAIRAENTSVYDVMFAAPIMIYATILAPTIKGLGVREFVFGQLLGKTAGYSSAVTFSHLGLWTGEVIPFILSIPVLLLGGRPSREQVEEELAELKRHSGERLAAVHLPEAEVALYRARVYGTLAATTLGGLIAGAVIGLMESAWIWRTIGSGLSETSMFVWGPIVYGFLFAGVGFGVGCGLLYLYLVFNRFLPWTLNFGLGFAGSFAAGGLVIGMFRLKRDVLEGFNPTASQALPLLIVVAGIALVGAAVCYMLAAIGRRSLKGRPVPLMGAAVVVFAALIGGGVVAATVNHPGERVSAFTPAQEATGPNIILIAIDTLRADYLKLYNPEAKANTPNIDAFAQDSMLFAKAFSQASWTKASFGTIFTGMYPECHTAVTKTASLPQDVETIAELLQAGGYYTQGYSNNPNITSLFGYDQGYATYVDLKPSLLFGAGESASKLSMYEVMRAVREKVKSKIPGFKKLNIEEYYQPADSVRGTVTGWLDNSNAKENFAPFFLFTHFMDPHDPYRAPWDPRGGFGRKQLGDNPDPAIYKEQFQRAYNGAIEYLDEHLGAFLNDLKQRGLYDDSLIIITADHGEEFCEHGGWWHGQTLYEEQTAIPMIVKLPGNARAGERNIFIARNLDLAPTMLHFAGLPKGEMMQGQSLFDANNNPTNGNIAYSYAENNFEGIVLQAVRTQDAKMIRANEGNKRKLAPVETYNLAADATEQQNLTGSADIAELEQQLFSAIDNYQTICEEGAVEPTGPADVNPELQEQLDSLGYLGE